MGVQFGPWSGSAVQTDSYCLRLERQAVTVCDCAGVQSLCATGQAGSYCVRLDRQGVTVSDWTGRQLLYATEQAGSYCMRLDRQAIVLLSSNIT